MISGEGQCVEVRVGSIFIRVEPWGPDTARVRIAPEGTLVATEWDLQPAPAAAATVERGERVGTLLNGLLKVTLDDRGTARFFRTDNGEQILEERRWNRALTALGGGLYRAELEFASDPSEKLFGLGQHPSNFLDQKGCFVDLAQQNTQVSIPFLLSSRKYGFLWNNPAVGRVLLGRNGTRWIANETRQLDYLVTVGDSFADIMRHYADATGHPPVLPEWAAGFWQCKLRYETQAELLEVAREYKRRGLPISVIVIDYFHWTCMGDWKFDPVCWPDPAAMVKELDAMGIRVMISVWPHVNPASENFETMEKRGLLVGVKRGLPALLGFEDTGSDKRAYLHLYDPTHPEGRRFHWEKVRENYYRHGIKVWWLDACEPELSTRDHENLRYHIGSGAEVGCLYPLAHARTFFDGMRAEGETDVITLCRSAWAGSQRYGAALWSGDIHSSFPSLREQVKAGLNVACSGIPWWTTDIGGFAGGDPNDPAFRELLVRWFQYGTFCPLFRLHGVRIPATNKTGGPNEVWSYGEDVYVILRAFMEMRERLRPYIMDQMRVAAETGLPPMRPLFFDFAADPEAYNVEDAFLFGPALLVAPVLQPGAVDRQVYLPKGAEWTDVWTGRKFAGGKRISAAAPQARLPLYLRDGARLPVLA